MTTRLKSLRDWVAQVAQLTSPDRIHWCDGTDQEYRKLLDEMLDNGTLLELNQSTYPGCYLHRSDPEDVARVEHLTYVCTKDAADAGPNNNWKEPAEAKTLMESCFAGCMRGRTMYVIPYCMGPIDSPYARCGVEITDSPYVVANMYLMTRIGKPALKRIEKDKTFVKGLHSTGELDPARRFIVHFPEELTIMSFGSGYGGNALLGKKCHALRIASYPSADGRLARGAHADRRRAKPGRRHSLSRLRVPLRLRQDESRDVDPAREPCRAGRSGRSATTSRGCISTRTASCAPSTPKPATSASCRARTRKRTATPTT